MQGLVQAWPSPRPALPLLCSTRRGTWSFAGSALPPFQLPFSVADQRAPSLYPCSARRGTWLSAGTNFRLFQLLTSVLILLFTTSSIIQIVEKMPFHQALYLVRAVVLCALQYF